MRIRHRKLLVFILTEMLLTLFFMAVLFISADSLNGLGITIVVMVVLNGVTYIGGNVLSTWAKSKYFQSDLVGK